MFREAAVVGLAVLATGNMAMPGDQFRVKRDGAHGGGHGHGHGDPHGDPHGHGHGDPHGDPPPHHPDPHPHHPDTNYAESNTYEEPSYPPPAQYGHDHEASSGLPDFTPLIIAVLVLTGLSLLFPSTVSIASGKRRKRETGEETSPMTDVLDRVNDIYMAVVESEECMERIACEVGGLAQDMGISTMAKMADPLVPRKYKAYYKQFTNGSNCKKIKCGSFF